MSADVLTWSYGQSTQIATMVGGKEVPTETKPTLLKPGDVLDGRWEILRHIATGGKGEVYLARQSALDRDVAVKVVSQELIDAYEGDQEEIAGEMERFRREVLAMAKMRHPNVLQVHDFERGELERDGGGISFEYIVMEYIPGDDLKSTIPDGGLAGDDQALRSWIRDYFLPVLDGVEYIHELGIVHRDLKPANVMLDGQTPKITDFGLVGGALWTPVTRSHHVMGTLAYMAPEQFMEMAEADARADIYSLGKILYNAAVGKLGKDNMLPLKTARLPEPATPFLRVLDQLLRRATAEDPDQRLASVAELRREVLALPGLAPAPAEAGGRARLWALAAAVLVLLLGWGVWYHFQAPAERAAAPTAQLPAATAPAATPATSLPPGPPPETISGKDGATARLVPAGPATLADGRQVAVATFYLDETPVTNHQFVEFLNAVGERLKVAEGMVRGDGKMWLALGEVRQGYEPIAYRQGRFAIKDATLAAHPVVKVSAQGAAAYAAHYGRRLPDSRQYLRALQAGGPAGRTNAVPAAPEVTPTTSMVAMHAQMNQQDEQRQQPYAAVSSLPANGLELHGLGGGLGEWVRDGDGYAVMETRDGQTGARATKAWETLSWVGFRTARDL